MISFLDKTQENDVKNLVFCVKITLLIRFGVNHINTVHKKILTIKAEIIKGIIKIFVFWINEKKYENKIKIPLT